MDVIASFKAALMQARKAELDVRAEALTELDDMTALKKFLKELETALEKLRSEGKIPDEPLIEFLGQCSRVLLWQYKLVEQEDYFAKRISGASKGIDELIGQGLPEEAWVELQNDVASLEDEFRGSHAEWQASLPAELWMVAEGTRAAEVRDQLNDLLLHAWNTERLTEAVGWQGWSLDTPPDSVDGKAERERDIEITCEHCNEELKFSFGLAGKESECPECYGDIALPAAAKVSAERAAQAREKQAEQAADGEQEKHPGLPGGWRDHFDATPEARERLAARPHYDAATLDKLRTKVADTAERKETWQKYYPRIAATGLPFDSREAWDLIVQDPAEVVGRLTDEWPDSDWPLSPKVSALFASGDMGFGEGVALLATDKVDLEKQTRNEIRERLSTLPPILSSSDYRWACGEADRVKLVYTKLLERKCVGFGWMRSFEVKEELTNAFAAGFNVAEGLDEMLTGKSNKQQLSEADVEDLFDRIRRVKGIAADLYCHDGSKLVDSRELPGDWRFHYWDVAPFESPDWVVGNPLVAVHLLASDLPQIVADFTGRQQLLEWRARSLELLNDEALTPARKAMLLPVMLGLSNEILFISERPEESEASQEFGKRPGALQEVVNKSFRSAEVKEMLESDFPNNLALYCEEHSLLQTMESEATNRRKGVSFAIIAAIAVAVIGAGWFGYNIVSKKMRDARDAAAAADAASLAAMVLTYEVDRSNIPTNITAAELVIKVNGQPVATGSQLEAGAHSVELNHPAYKTFEKNIVMSPGSGVDLGTIKLEAATGAMSVESDPPGATVTMGGREVGKTPVKLPSIPSGASQIALTLAGYGTWKTNAVVGKDQALTISYRFGRGTVQFSTTPTGFHFATGPQSGGLKGLEWDGPATPKTPQQKEFLPGEYTAAFVHPTMGSHQVVGFTVVDKQEVPVSHEFTVAKATLPGVPAGAKLWRGIHTFGQWIAFDTNWQFDSRPALTLLRFSKPGHLPLVYPLQASGGSFTPPTAISMSSGGSVECWGSNAKRQSTVPTELQARKFLDVAAGKNHTVGLLDNGQVVCWGDNTFGQSGVPAELGPCVMIAAGDNHTAALRSDGTAICWGANQTGQATVPEGLGNCVSISAAGNRTAVIRNDGGISGWGYGAYQLPPKSEWRPYVDISLGAYYITALDDQGQSSIFAQTTSGVGSPSAEATAAEAGGPYLSVAGGTTAALWLTPGGSLVSVGRDPRAQKVPHSLGPFRSVAGGYTRVAVVTRDNRALIWGRKTGMSSRSGFERKTDADTKVQYWERAGNFIKIECGENHYVGIRR
jgi:hypothetical protein